MTAVQWWCSGVVLNTDFGSSSSSPRPQALDPTLKDHAAGRGQLGQIAQAAGAQSVGQTFDRVA